MPNIYQPPTHTSKSFVLGRHRCRRRERKGSKICQFSIKIIHSTQHRQTQQKHTHTDTYQNKIKTFPRTPLE